MPIFANTHFLVVSNDRHGTADHEEPSSEKIGKIIEENGGQVHYKLPADCKGVIKPDNIGHVITETAGFADSDAARDLMVPVTTAKWVWDSVAQAQKRNYRLYAPFPAPFMDKVVVCIADNLPQGDKEIMYAGVRAFGGQFLDSLSRYTTHLIASDLTNNKSVVAANIRKRDDFDIKIVLPHWIDACIRQRRHVSEAPFLLTNATVLHTGKPDFSIENVDSAPDSASLAPKDPSQNPSQVLAYKNVFVASDFHLSEHLKASIYSLIESLGGVLQHEFDPEKIDVYVGKYRSGAEFEACLSRSKIDVASLSWLYHIAINRHYVSPLASNLLHFPVPEDEIPQFKNLRISVTGISGDARHYLASLVVAMGGTFTKTLDCNNDFLVCASKSGDKYNAARTRWPDVKIVNHLWVEECFAKWSFLDSKAPRYATISDKVQWLGEARLSKSLIEEQCLGDGNVPSDVGDSVHENDGDIDSVSSPAPAPPSHSPLPVAKLSSFNTAQNTQLSRVSQVSQVSDASQEPTATPNVPLSSERDMVDDTKLSSPMTSQARAGRSAKAKASLKLHSDMEDLNQYTSMSKSSRKMKTYMEHLEKSTPSKKQKQVVEVSEEDTEQRKPKKAKVEKKANLVAILTGCEQVLNLGRADVNKLLKLGIQIVNDYSSKKSIDTIIAPKVLRTEKFLKSLSQAKQIVHPSFLSDILNRHSVNDFTWSDLIKEFNIENYFLDKVVPVKQINEDLGILGKESGLNRLLSPHVGPVFEGFALNFSSNLVGGPDLISSILSEHGLAQAKTVKLTAGTRKSGLLSMDDGTTILIAHKAKDKKAVSKLEDVTVVDWEWCVKSIFHKKAQSYEEYKV